MDRGDLGGDWIGLGVDGMDGDWESGYTSSKEDEVVDIFTDNVKGFKQRMQDEDGGRGRMVKGDSRNGSEVDQVDVFSLLFASLFYRFLALPLSCLLCSSLYSLIKSLACTFSAGSQELSLVGYPFHLIR
jgi:hypothetical protein